MIRIEIPVDAQGIDALLRRAFNRDDEACLVHKLREDGLLTLGIVATDDEGGVIGYAAFSPVLIDGEDRQWVALAPLAVDQPFRGQGIGGQLLYTGLDTLNEFGYHGVVVLGSPDWYSRFGFRAAAELPLECRWPGSEVALQMFSLSDEALVGLSGQVEFAEHFNALS